MFRMRMVFLYSTPIRDALALMEKHGASIAGWISSGSSGGNPEFFLDFDTKESAVALWKEMNPDDEDELILENIEAL